jgi:hypothetical protein
MMKIRWICGVLLILSVYSCQKDPVETSFHLKIEGFTLDEGADFSTPDHITFQHRYSGGIISFNQGGQKHSFEVEKLRIEDYEFILPVGKYSLKSFIPDASLYGQNTGSFTILPTEITLTEQTDTVLVRVEANCSLVLVEDNQGQLEQGPYVIERHSYASGYFKAYALDMDTATALYYTYLTPDPEINDPSAFLWFYNDTPGLEQGGLSTSQFKKGFRYFISILE